MKQVKKKILIYHCGAIGDSLVVIPLVRNIIRHNPDSVIDIFNFFPGTYTYHLNVYKELGGLNDITHQCLPYDLVFSSWWIRFKNLMNIRKKNYDKIFVFFLSYTPKWWKPLFQIITGVKDVFLIEAAPSGTRISESIRKQMELYGMPFLPEEATIHYPLSEKHLKKGMERFIGLSIPEDKIPFVMGISGKSESCMYWPMERYKELLRRIVPNLNLYPVIIGAPSEKGKANDLLSVCKTGCFVGDLQVAEVIAFMKHFGFYFGNDTGTMHLADSAGIPCITLFSNKDVYKSWFPEGDHHINIIHQQKCGECRHAICPLGNPAPCIEKITIDEVENAIRQFVKTLNRKN